MNYGSSEEEDSEEEARAQDRRGEEVDGQEDGHRPSQDGQEEINCKGAGLVPAPSLFLFRTVTYRKRGTGIGSALLLYRRASMGV
jgi:hypothetical protein